MDDEYAKERCYTPKEIAYLMEDFTGRDDVSEEELESIKKVVRFRLSTFKTFPELIEPLKHNLTASFHSPKDSVWWSFFKPDPRHPFLK